MDVSFANPVLLYLLWLVPALGAWWYLANRRRGQALSAFVSGPMQAKLAPSAASSARFLWQAGLITAGLLLLLFAAARPQWGSRDEVVYQRARDLIIALDVSRSMLANDVHPNRLERAKADILDVIREIPGDRVGLIAFRRTAELLCPLTTDYAYVRQALDAVTTESAPRGETNIGDAILKALQAFESDEGSHKAIILISDGEDLSGTALAAADKAGEKRIPIFTVGIGNRRGSTIPEEAGSGTVKFKNEEVTTRLDNDTLFAIANKTGGAYIPVETASMGSVTLGTLYRDHLSKITALDQEEVLQRRRVERFQYFLLPGVLLLLAGACLSRGRLVGRGQRAEIRDQRSERNAAKIANPQATIRRALPLLALLTLSLPVLAQTNTPAIATSSNTATKAEVPYPAGRNGARAAQKLYLLGQYETAAQAYQDAARTGNEKAQRDYHYNAAASLFKAGKNDAAADILKELVLSHREASERDYMGLGTALFRAASSADPTNPLAPVAREKSLRDAGEAFKEAARTSAESKASRENLAVVVQALPEAEEQATVARLTQKYAQSQAGQIAGEMLAAQRQLLDEIPPAFTNADSTQIQSLEKLARRQKDNADLWIPLKGKLLEALSKQPAEGNTNAQQQVAMVNQIAEATRDQMRGAGLSLRDLDPQGYGAAKASEGAIYHLWKAVAPYDLLLREDILRQTNVITATRTLPAAGDKVRAETQQNQDEAGALTSLFVERFSQAVPEAGTAQPAASPTNALTPAGPTVEAAQGTNQPGITAEDRKKILDLADKAIAAQKESSQHLDKSDLASALTREQESHDLLKEIEKLLPKQSQQQQQQDQNQDQQQQQSQQEPQQQPQEQKPKPDKEEPKPDPQKDMNPEDVKKMIEKALQREKEHEAEKRRMNQQYVLPSSVERDW